MDIHDNFEKKISYLSMFNGVGLSMEEKLKLDIALKELHFKTEAEECLFWGKIIGTKFDYYIALLVNYKGNYEFPIKKFFFTNNIEWEFRPLADTLEQHKDKIELFHFQSFSGDPKEVLFEEKEEEGDNMDNKDDITKPVDPLAVDDSLDNIKEEKVVKKTFLEEHKLAWTVLTIDFETSIFPQGAIKLIPIHELRRNDNFKGLKSVELKDITKYSHFRKITQPEKKENIEKDEAIFRFDILDDLNKGKYKNTWTFQLDSTGNIVNIRSLLWPGYFAFHKAETNLYGGAYFGDGIKNADMPFMI